VLSRRHGGPAEEPPIGSATSSRVVFASGGAGKDELTLQNRASSGCWNSVKHAGQVVTGDLLLATSGTIIRSADTMSSMCNIQGCCFSKIGPGI